MTDWTDEQVPALLARAREAEAERDEVSAKLAALREHTLDSNPALRSLHDAAVAYRDAVAALAEVQDGAPLSTTIGYLIRRGHLVPTRQGRKQEPQYRFSESKPGPTEEQLAELRADAERFRRQLLDETYRPEGGEIVMRELADVKAERDRLAAQVAAVRTLHVREVELYAAGEGQIVEKETCRYCSNLDVTGFAVAWPCPTIRALDGTGQDEAGEA